MGLTAVAIVGATAAVVGGGVSAYGSMEQGHAASQAASFNAEVAAQNQQLATQNATRAAQAGDAQAGAQQQKTRAEVGAITTAQAAGNVDVNSGSAVDVRSSASELGELNALSVKSSAATQAFGYETQATSFQDQATLDTAQAASASTAGTINAGSSVLGGVSSAASNYGRYVSQNSPMTAPGGSSDAAIFNGSGAPVDTGPF